MAKRRLLQWMRDNLVSHARSVVAPAAEKKVLDAAYRKAEPMVLAAVAKRFPPDDMKVLKKYGCTRREAAVTVQFPTGVVTQFKFDDDRAPEIANHPYDQRIFLVDAAAAAAIEKWQAARDAYKAERNARLNSYQALIAGARYVEDVVEVWPEAKGLLPAGSPPLALGPEQIALVKADLRERKAA